MGALVVAVVILAYLGRILALVWGVKPLELGDAIFLLPIPLLVLTVRWQEARRRRLLNRRHAPSVPAPFDRHDWLTDDEAGDRGHREPRGATPSAAEERLREQQEWATARYHWWKQ